MNNLRPHRIRLSGTAAVLALCLALPAGGDDKNLLVRTDAPSNLMIVFGNSQTTQQPISGSTSAWDGDADSPASKMGAAKRVITQFVQDKAGQYNFGLTSFAHNPNANSITILRKHWLYAPLTTDYPSESWREPAGTIGRWGNLGLGPCTSLTVPACSDRSPAYVTLAANATVVGPFFGVQGGGTAYIYLNGNSSSATQRIKMTLTTGKYGDAYADATLAAYSISSPAPAHSMEVRKEYQTKPSGNWTTAASTPNGDLAEVTVFYIPPTTLPLDLFFQADPDGGKAIGFLSDRESDFDVDANCSGWEFQTNSAPLPLVKVPRDYLWGATCKPVQDSVPCISRLMRPQASLVHYDQANGNYVVTDHDNPGYQGSGSKYADGCDSDLLGGVNAGLDVAENQAILTTRNGSQAPIKNLLDNIYDYFSNSSIDGFSNGKRTDDPNKACRKSAVVLIYDNFNGCQNDSCGFLTGHVLKKLKQIGVPVYVIGLGSSAVATSSTGVCIAQNSGAILPDGTVGYFPVTSAAGLYTALSDIASFVNEATKDFASSTVSSVQTGGDQMIYLATFNAAKNRSIWNGRVNGYKLDPSGLIQMGEKTISDPLDPDNGLTLPAPSNDPSSLIWNAGENLTQTPGTGATDSSAVLGPGMAMSSGTYIDNSTDTVTTIPTHFYPGRKLVFSLPQGYADPVTAVPIPPSDMVPENRYDLTYSTGATWWPALKALLGPQVSPPAVLLPALTDVDAGNSLRFIWGDRDAVMTTTEANQRYLGTKLGDTFHSSPVIVGRPADFAFHDANLNNYQAFFKTYRQRRRVLLAGANDGLLHAFDVGVFNRDPSVCSTPSDGSLPPCYDLGTGAELFAYAPRAIMQIFRPLKDAVGPQTKKTEWTVDGAPSAADVFIDGNHAGTPVPANRTWHTVLVGGMREGSPFEGTSGVAPKSSRGTYFALDITQPDELVGDGASGVGPPSGAGTSLAPKCLNANGDPSCGKDAPDAALRSAQPARAWPTVMWEITDTGDLDAAGSPGAGYGDFGETWSKPAMGRVRVCTANCGNTSAPLPTTVDHYVAIYGGGFDRERLNRRGNWLYMIDVETGKTLYRVNSSCGVNSGAAGCSPTYFASMPAESGTFDFNGDGYLDYVYIGDLKGQMWRIDLTDLRQLSSPSGGRWNNQLDLVNGSGKPFLFFQAPQPVAPATEPFYPMYFRPTAVSLGFSSGGKPTVGLAFGTGDRDDVISVLDPASLSYKQRFYYVIDDSNSSTRTETDLLNIPSATSAAATTVPTKGWFLQLAKGERLVTDSLSIKGVIFFGTFNPIPPGTTLDACNNQIKCLIQRGEARFYRLLYSTADAFSGTDRGDTQEHANFLTNPVLYESGGGGTVTEGESTVHVIHTTDNSVDIDDVPGGRRTTVKDWKENERPN
jgi:Tfp pilus tip-associated adhesin PilY1